MTPNHLSVESKRPRKLERDVPCTKVQVSFEDPLWFMHKRHSLQVEGARGGGIPQLQISASKYEVADAPNPPTPQICAHQKPKNWRCTHCSVYCKTSQKNLITSSPLDGSRQIGPRTIGPRTVGPWTIGARSVGPGARLSGAQLSAPQKWQIGPQTVGPQK